MENREQAIQRLIANDYEHFDHMAEVMRNRDIKLVTEYLNLDFEEVIDEAIRVIQDEKDEVDFTVSMLEEHVSTLEGTIEELEAENEDLKETIHRLRHDLKKSTDEKDITISKLLDSLELFEINEKQLEKITDGLIEENEAIRKEYADYKEEMRDEAMERRYHNNNRD